MEAIVQTVAIYCGCSFTDDQVTGGEFQCFPSSPGTISYRAKIRAIQQMNISLLVMILREWASSVKTVTVDFMPLSVDGFCARTSSSSLEECPSPNILSVNQSNVPRVIVALHVIIVMMACIELSLT